jgi:hypothetical protein
MKSLPITFTLQLGDEWVSKDYYPVPASKMIPEWYKNLPSYQSSANRFEKSKTQSIKRCMPVFDAFSAGYYILTFTDLTVTRDENGVAGFQWAYDTQETITFHAGHQLEGYKGLELPYGAAKIRNPWAVKTPSGYSSFFMPPVHQNPIGLRILEGYVDTDTYSNPVQFPFLLDDNFVGDIPAGTPIAQVIPFKRDNFEMSIGGQQERNRATEIALAVRTRFVNGYRDSFRQEKRYL